MKKKTIHIFIGAGILSVVLSGCSVSNLRDLNALKDLLGNKEKVEEEQNDELEEKEDIEEIEESEETETDSEDKIQKVSSIPVINIEKQSKTNYQGENWVSNIEWDEVTVEGECPEFKKAIEALAKERKETAISSIEGMVNDNSWDYSDMLSPDYPIFEEVMSFSVERADTKYYSISTNDYAYYGGAHGGNMVNGYNYEVATGKLLSLQDVVKDISGFESKATKDIINQLADVYGDGLFPEYKDTVKQMWSGTPVWILKAGGIEFVFNQYEVGPYAMGIATVTLDYDNYKELLNEEYFIPEGASILKLDWNADNVFKTAEGLIHARLDVKTDEYGDCIEASIALSNKKISKGNVTSADAKISKVDLEDYSRIISAHVLNREDGKTLLLLNFDYASDDYCLQTYDISDGKFSLCDEQNDLYVLKCNRLDQITTRVQMDVLGSYSATMDYHIESDGKLTAMEDIFTIDNNSSYATLTVKSPIPVTINGQQTSLEAGTNIRIIATDMKGTAYFQNVDTKEEGTIQYEDGSKYDGWGCYIDGKQDVDCFENVPYAG